MKKITKSIGALAMLCFFVDVGAQTPPQEARDSLWTEELDEVVVTALGIKREKKALGYSTQEVKVSELTAAPSTNFTQGLSGKVSGLQVKGTGNFAGSVDVVLRGYRSILGNNSPLYVVDGVPILNANNNPDYQAKSGRHGYDFGNTVSDINPNDIEEVNVLKGAAASAIYGSRAQNGAIIITTKKGKKDTKGIGIAYSATAALSAIDRSTFAKYQTQYGQGYEGASYSADYDPTGGGTKEDIVDFSGDASFGHPFDPNKLVWQYGAFIPGSPYSGRATPWVAAKNDPSKFFETGENYVHDLALTKTGDTGSFRFSYQRQQSSDIMPNSKLGKNSFALGGSYALADRLNATFNASFVNQDVTGRNVTGYSQNQISAFRQWWAVNVDMHEQRDFYNMSRKNYSWNMVGPDRPVPQYWNNPYFERYENYTTDSRERVLGNFSLNYDINPNISLLARMGTDGYTMRMDERKAIGSLAQSMGVGQQEGTGGTAQPSGYAVEDIKERESNYDFIASYKREFENAFSLNGLLGSNINVRNYRRTGLSTSGGLLIPGVYTIANSVSTPLTPIQKERQKKVVGVFGQAQVGYQGTYYVEGTLRRDQSSALPKGNNDYWYYSVSGSMVFSNWDFLRGSPLSFGKIRASYAEVGSDTDADQLQNQYFVTSPFQGNPVTYYNTSAKNADLRPERSKQTELGLNAVFFNNRVGFDLAWFRGDSYDQILPLSQSSSTGVYSYVQNVGTLRTDGWEIALNLVPVKTVDFRWDMDLNWSNPYTKVLSLAEGIENITIGRYQGGVSINASLNDPYGTIKGQGFVYRDGQKVVADDGSIYLRTNSDNVIGNIQAKWFGGMVNTLAYKNLSLGFQIDMRKGGDIFSLDQHYGLDTGLYPETAGQNDIGGQIRGTGPNDGVILPGVHQNGTPNTTRIQLDGGHLGYGYQPAQGHVYDGSFVKLRQASIGYAFPKPFLDRTFIQNLTLAFVGSNLWIIHKNLPYADPEAGLSSGNAQGWQSGVMPTSRVFSLNLKVDF